MPPLDAITPLQWAIAIIAAFFIGVSKAGFAGVGLVGIYLMTEILPARESTGATLPMIVFTDLWVISSLGHHAKWELIWHFLPLSIVGIGAGYFIFAMIPEQNFRFVVGVVILLLVIGSYARRAILRNVPARPGGPPRAAGWTLGLIAGVNTMIANSAGPFTAMYLLLDSRLSKLEFVGTNAWLFVILNVTKLPLSWSLGVITPRSLAFNACLIPALLLGVSAGRAALDRVSQRAFEHILLLFCLVAALRLMMG